MIAIPETIESTDGVTLRLHDLGGAGPPLLLCHATGFCGPVWGPMAADLAADFRCIALDFRAHGASTRPIDRPLEWTGFADDVRAAKAAISPDAPVTAVGHSMGGAALALAEATAPGTVARAWTFEPILFTGNPPAGQEPPDRADAGDGDAVGDGVGAGDEGPEIAQGARRRRAVFASRDEVIERYSAKPPLSVLAPEALRAYADHGFRDLPDGTVTLCCRPEDEASVFEHHNSGAFSAIGRVTVPFAVAAGGDGQRPAEAVVAAAEAYPQLQLRCYDDLTHFGPLQDPPRIAADVRAWMAANRPGG